MKHRSVKIHQIADTSTPIQAFFLHTERQIVENCKPIYSFALRKTDGRKLHLFTFLYIERQMAEICKPIYTFVYRKTVENCKPVYSFVHRKTDG